MSLAAELISGGVAGAAGILATQPLDTIRIRLQCSVEASGRPRAGILECARACLRNEGARGLYKGVASPTLTVGGMSALLFFSYESASRAIRRASAQREGNELSLGQVFLAGASSGVATAFITSPTELVKCHAQINTTSKGYASEELAIFRTLLRKHGFFSAHGPWRGLLLTIARDSPSFGLYFVMYEGISRHFGKSDFVSFAAGGCAGAAAYASVYPLDVLKTRWQTAEVSTYRSLAHCVESTVRTDGRGAFFRGFLATMLRAWPQNGVVFVTYETMKRALGE